MRETPLSRGAISQLLAALRLADLRDFDPQPENFVAAGSFCFAPPGAPPQQVRSQAAAGRVTSAACSGCSTQHLGSICGCL